MAVPVPGDVLVITKPLGSKVSLTALQWLEANDKKRLERITLLVSESEIRTAYETSLKFKNDKASSVPAMVEILKTKYECIFVEIGELGILGQAQKIIEIEGANVNCLISNLPIIGKMDFVGRMYENEFQLIEGYAPENLGGLLICMSREDASEFVSYVRNEKGVEAWIVGVIIEGNGVARMSKQPKVINVTYPSNL